MVKRRCGAAATSRERPKLTLRKTPRSRQAVPTPMTSTPVAMGSSVPPCPTLMLTFRPARRRASFSSTPRIFCTTSLEVQSSGL